MTGCDDFQFQLQIQFQSSQFTRLFPIEKGGRSSSLLCSDCLDTMDELGEIFDSSGSFDPISFQQDLATTGHAPPPDEKARECSSVVMRFR